MGDDRRARVFVTVIARDVKHLREVFRFGLDLFEGGIDAEKATIEGLVDLDDVAMLVEAGYRVMVKDTDRPKREHRFVEFDEWRKETLEDLERARKEA